MADPLSKVFGRRVAAKHILEDTFGEVARWAGGPELALSDFLPASDAVHGMTGEGPRTIPVCELASLRWRNSWSGAKAGMLTGVLGGAAAGALIANANCHSVETGLCNGLVQGFGAGVGAFVGLALGLVVGAAIGADDRVEFDRSAVTKSSD